MYKFNLFSMKNFFFKIIEAFSDKFQLFKLKNITGFLFLSSYILKY